MKGSTIQIANPGAVANGALEEVVVSGTPKPGQLAQLTNNAAVGGRFKYALRTLPNGTFGPIAVFVEAQPMWDWKHTYADGDRGWIKWVLPGEYVNIYITIPGTGSGTIYNIGQLLEPDSAGNLVGQGVGATSQNIFQCMEAVVDPGNVLTTQLTFVQRIF